MLTLILLVVAQVAQNVPPPPDPQHELKVSMDLDAAFFAEADKNGDDGLSLDEFVAGMDRRIDAAIAANPAAQKKITPENRVAMREKMLAPAFRSFDKNSDGILTLAEITPAAKPEQGAAH
jgi:Ca2+-binding EF-hand superfamily protein